ncbi:MAG TPA: hypothetical protein VFR97_04245 [Capillimicrobium sp.]|nr:hypothetical protein [Capillimicrobium sp.]
MRTDPTDTGGLFTGRRPGTAPVRYRQQPQRGSGRRQRIDDAIALLIAAAMAVVNLLFWGPMPIGALWVASRVAGPEGNRIFLAIVVAFALCLGALMLGLMVLKRLDAAWIIVRRAAGHDQRQGIVAPMFGACAAVGATAFFVWLVFIGGLGSSMMPGS